jgi:hypothetical protein
MRPIHWELGLPCPPCRALFCPALARSPFACPPLPGLPGPAPLPYCAEPLPARCPFVLRFSSKSDLFSGLRPCLVVFDPSLPGRVLSDGPAIYACPALLSGTP